MNCKNCSHSLSSTSLYCNNCGAKVVNQRITIKSLFTNFTSTVFGWDNKFFFTLKHLLLRPSVVLQEYLDGTRKKYMNPFTLLGITSAIAIFIFNFFADDYLALQVATNEETIKGFANLMKTRAGDSFDAEAYTKEQMEMITTMSSFTLKYFNLLIILLLPLYTLLSYIVYRKPYFYAEHLVINIYVQSVSFVATSIAFTLCIYTNPVVYSLAVIFAIVFYTYAYGKLYKLTIAESILKLLIFFGILIGFIVLTGILSILLGYLFAMLTH